MRLAKINIQRFGQHAMRERNSPAWYLFSEGSLIARWLRFAQAVVVKASSLRKKFSITSMQRKAGDDGR